MEGDTFVEIEEPTLAKLLSEETLLGARVLLLKVLVEEPVESEHGGHSVWLRIDRGDCTMEHCTR